MNDGLLMQLLTTFGYSLPELVAYVVALAMLWSGAQPGRPRDLGLWGIGLMLACAVLQLGIGLYQSWMINQMQGDSIATMSRMVALLSGVRLLINCLSLVGLILVVRGLCLAARKTRTAPPAL
ncbi:MAG: hypothetical protein ACREO0_06885 [Pseudoxanthomonas sp.]